MLHALARRFHDSPAVRFVCRATASGGAGYVVDAITAGDPLSLHALASAAATAGLYAIAGYLTPLEPFVGKTARVDVPVPPAEPDRRR